MTCAFQSQEINVGTIRFKDFSGWKNDIIFHIINQKNVSKALLGIGRAHILSRRGLKLIISMLRIESS